MTSSAAAQRAAAEGPNELKKPPVPGLLLLFVMQLTNLIIMLLSASAVASIIVNASGSRSDEAISYVEGIAIFVIVILNAGIAAYTENSANNALAALAKIREDTLLFPHLLSGHQKEGQTLWWYLLPRGHPEPPAKLQVWPLVTQALANTGVDTDALVQILPISDLSRAEEGGATAGHFH